MSDDEFLQEALTHVDMVYNLARRMTSSRDDAEDLVQETYARALKAWRRERPRHMPPWLATICLNAARSLHRRRKNRPTEVLNMDQLDDLPAAGDTSEQALAELDRDAVGRALARLTTEQREAITLMDLCGFTAAQVGKMLGVSRNTVLSRVHRGHKRLAVLLEEVMGGEA